MVVEDYTSHNGRYQSDVISKAFAEAELIGRHAAARIVAGGLLRIVMSTCVFLGGESIWLFRFVLQLPHDCDRSRLLPGLIGRALPVPCVHGYRHWIFVQ